MLKIKYSYINVPELCRQLSRELNLTISENFSASQPCKGGGSICYMKLPNELELLFMDYTPKEDVLFQRKNPVNVCFFLRIDGIGYTDASKSSVFFGNVKHETFYMATANKRNTIIRILLTEEWMDKYFANENTSDFFKKSIFHTEASYHYEFLDSEYKRLVSEMMQLQADASFANFIIQNRVMLILERFFSRVYRKFSETNLYVKASAEQLERLKVIENMLVKDVSFIPPTIAQLSKISALSTTKLKSLFKEVYGLPVYRYFQKHRMQKAKAMLLSKKYSVRETANELGYTNLKDFTKAFEKNFDQLPEEIAAKK